MKIIHIGEGSVKAICIRLEDVGVSLEMYIHETRDITVYITKGGIFKYFDLSSLEEAVQFLLGEKVK